MRPTQTPASRFEPHQPVRDHGWQSTSPNSIGPGTDNLGPSLPSDEEFLSRFGDTIDDRIADILDELLTERSSARKPRRGAYLLAAISVILAALAASVLLRL